MFPVSRVSLLSLKTFPKVRLPHLSRGLPSLQSHFTNLFGAKAQPQFLLCTCPMLLHPLRTQLPSIPPEFRANTVNGERARHLHSTLWSVQTRASRQSFLTSYISFRLLVHRELERLLYFAYYSVRTLLLLSFILQKSRITLSRDRGHFSRSYSRSTCCRRSFFEWPSQTNTFNQYFLC